MPCVLFSDGDFNSVQSTEVIESALPLRVERYGIREGSCGDGQYRGGFGMHREIRVLQGTGSLSVLSERNVIPPFGVMGGFSGAPNQFNIRRNGQIIGLKGSWQSCRFSDYGRGRFNHANVGGWRLRRPTRTGSGGHFPGANLDI